MVVVENTKYPYNHHGIILLSFGLRTTLVVESSENLCFLILSITVVLLRDLIGTYVLAI